MWKRIGLVVAEVALIVAAIALVVAMLVPVKYGASPDARNRDFLGMPIRGR
jgi:hypothetical protein